MDVQKIINTIRIKEINGLDTEKEYAELIDMYVETADCTSKTHTTAPVIFGLSHDPLEACRQILPVYNAMLKRLTKTYEELAEKQTDPALVEQFTRTYLAYDETASLFAGKMMDYASDAAEETLPEIERSPFLSAEEKKNGDPYKNLEKVFAVIRIICHYLEDAVTKADKPKLMTLSALLFGTSHDILMILRKIKTPAAE